MALYRKSREEWIESNSLLIRTMRLRRAVEAGIAEVSAILARLIANEAEIRGHYGTGNWFPQEGIVYRGHAVAYPGFGFVCVKISKMA